MSLDVWAVFWYVVRKGCDTWISRKEAFSNGVENLGVF
jgi:hypothetical protein